MDMTCKTWVRYKNKGLEYRKDGKKILLNNPTNRMGYIIFPGFMHFKQAQEVAFFGGVVEGAGASLLIMNKKKAILGEFSLGSAGVFDTNEKNLITTVRVMPHTSIVIDKISFGPIEDVRDFYKSVFDVDMLVITPGYPSVENRYFCGFVHSRMLAYKKAGLKFRVLSVSECPSTSVYTYEGIEVLRTSFYELRRILQAKNFKRLAIHFFDNRFANVLEACDMTKTKMYFFLHGSDILYWDWTPIASQYFQAPLKINDEMRSLFELKDFYAEKYNNFPNAKWCFVTQYTKDRAEELLGIKFKNYEIVPCLVDTELFKYEKKDPELRKKIFVLRKFEDISSYALDIVVRTILELSHRSFFKDLEFDIYGSGSMHDEILRPVVQFSNVHVYDEFLNREGIRKVHEEHGIALFPTRYDSQAVSSCEAASSGCAVITSDIRGTRQFIPDDLGVLCDKENYREYADVIEKMYYDEEYFLEVAEKESKSVRSKFDYKHTIEKEFSIYKKEKQDGYLTFEKPKEIVLSVIVPSYNVEEYLNSTVISLLDHRNRNKMEVIIVNDGSRDGTIKVARKLEKLTKYVGGSTVRVIDKENGGHGSTINVGIREAKGKYVKIVDGDDTVDSEELATLIDILAIEDSDIVLNNYIEDFAFSNTLNIKKMYEQLTPGIQYHFDDITYSNYGFTSWGPLLSCSSYKRKMLLDGDVKLSEKCFYVDMELNTWVAILCDTITFYDLNIYRYFLGREGQSVSPEAYKRNYLHHEKVALNMIDMYEKNKDSLSKSKQNYILNNLIRPMIKTQYEIVTNYCKTRKAFNSFDKKLKKHPEFYSVSYIPKRTKLYRKTGGFFVKYQDLFIRQQDFLIRVKNKIRKRIGI